MLVDQARLVNRNEIPAKIRYVIGNKDEYQSFENSIAGYGKNYIKRNKNKLRFDQIQHYDNVELYP